MLQHFQSLLSELYDTEQHLDVLDYLITDHRILAAIEDSSAVRVSDEKLLICECEGELALSLYLAPELLERLKIHDPRNWLGRRNFTDFCKLIEGISHFNYLVWNASADKSVTLLELEMQAEVDKYVGTLAVLASQPNGALADSLFDRLFDDPEFDAGLEPDELERYRSASAFAAKFCRSLDRRFPHGLLRPGMLDELRGFYRLPQPDKVSYICSATYT
ncbi:MAG TPA: hypothetical protein QF499_02835 [Gammaproteobacteria bacterium]|jgi:hypothetical protein|nr:hypothetical protein [Chromatiales bacterium]MCP4926618.1 hypothetical protein [Gammaproteobacteria bacterium]HJP38050.1 hypothetical protein [Gammaproteobacteria bacterium]